MTILEKIQNDKIIINLYNQISQFEDQDKGWAHHNLKHVKNVSNIVEKLLTDLGYKKDFIQEAQIAAILHDTGAIKGKDNHAKRSYEFAKQYIADNNIELENEEIVLEAIKIHSDGFNTKNIIALTLILADKLDITYTRVAKEGYNAKGMRQLQYIKEILVFINEGDLSIKFICYNKINRKELEEFYFINKVFKAIISFSGIMNLNPEVYLNKSKWKLFYKEMLDNEN